MKSVSSKIFLLVIAAIVLLACGKSLSEAESAYAKKCSTVAPKKLCECEAGIIASKLTPGELKAYTADWPKGALNPEALSKFTADNGFTMADYSSLNEKRKSLLPEIEKTCSGVK